MLLTVLCLVLSACAYSRSVLPEGVGLLSSSAVQEPDSLSSQHSPEMTSQPADLSISDFSPSVLSGEVGRQAECALSVLPVGLDREQLILINDNPDVVQIAELSFAEEGAGMVLRLRLAFVGEGKAQITVQSADGKSCSNTLQLEIGGREDSMMVFITPSGGKYHCSASCGGKNAFEVPLSQAIQEGYTPCKRCAGQQMSSLPVTGGRAEAQPAG